MVANVVLCSSNLAKPTSTAAIIRLVWALTIGSSYSIMPPQSSTLLPMTFLLVSFVRSTFLLLFALCLGLLPPIFLLPFICLLPVLLTIAPAQDAHRASQGSPAGH